MVSTSRFAEPPVFEVVGTVRTLSAEEKADLAAFAVSLRTVPRETFAGPGQARAPKGTRIGGQWIETALGILRRLTGTSPGVTPPGEEPPGNARLVESTGPRVLKTENGMYDKYNPTSRGDAEEVPDIRNDEGMSHDDLLPDAVDEDGRPFGPDAVARANEIHTQGILAEPKLTEDMRGAMAGSGGELSGLEYRLKNQESLATKIRGKLDEGKSLDTQTITDDIKDSVRYTATFKSADYAKGTQDAIDRLRSQGYQVDVKSFYEGPDANLAYKAIHGQMITPEGMKVELQFHTPESLAAKFAPEMHDIYDKQKRVPKGSPEFEDYEQQMRDYMTSIGYTPPPGADTIH